MTVLLWVLVALGVWYVAGREQDAKMKALAAKADTARVALDTARTVVIQTQYKTKAVSKREREAQMALTARLALLDDSIATYRAVAADGTATADTLREALVRATNQLDTLKGISQAYVVTVDSLRSAYAEERRASAVALEKAEAVIAVQDTLLLHQRPALLHRRVLQAFGVGVVTGIVLVLAR